MTSIAPAARVATSEHPVPAHAVAECAGSMLEADGPPLDTVMCAVGPSFGGALGDITDAMRTLLGAPQALGVVGLGALMGLRVARDTPSLVVLGLARPATVRHLPAGSDAEVLATRDPGREPSTWILVGDRPIGRGGPSLARRDGTWDGAWGGGHVPGRPTAGFRAAIRTPGADRPGPGQPDLLDREGVAALGLESAAVSVRFVHGTVVVGPPVTVSAMVGSSIAELDGIPAAGYLQDVLLRADPRHVEACTAVGFSAAPGDALIAARPSGDGLVTNAVVREGEQLFPSVLTPPAARSQLSEALSRHPGCASFALLDTAMPLGASPIDTAMPLGASPIDTAMPLGPAVASAGLFVEGLRWGRGGDQWLLAGSGIVFQLR